LLFLAFALLDHHDLSRTLEHLILAFSVGARRGSYCCVSQLLDCLRQSLDALR
jgi:hypothetical protein